MGKLTDNECSAYVRSGRICKNGFIQTHFCWAGASKCSCCGQESRAIPHCQREELPDHFINEDGSPRFYPGRTALEGSPDET